MIHYANVSIRSEHRVRDIKFILGCVVQKIFLHDKIKGSGSVRIYADKDTRKGVVFWGLRK